LYDRYYAGLKEEVKDELARDRPEGLEALIKMANMIDIRHYERAQERKGHYAPGPRRNRPNHQPRAVSYQNAHDPMDLDATQKAQPKWKGKSKAKKLSKEEKDRRYKEKLCFECGLPGHQAAVHRKQGQLKATELPQKTISATDDGDGDSEPRWDLTDSDGEREDPVEFMASLDSETEDIANMVVESDSEELGIEEIVAAPKDSEAGDSENESNQPQVAPQVDQIWKITSVERGRQRTWTRVASGAT
jgi:hypothetical protein